MIAKLYILYFRLPTPSGYGAQHVNRVLSDNEWRKMLCVGWFDFEGADIQAWKHLLDRLQVVYLFIQQRS